MLVSILFLGVGDYYKPQKGLDVNCGRNWTDCLNQKCLVWNETLKNLFKMFNIILFCA